MTKGYLSSWRANFLTGLAVVLPAAVSIAVVVWFFRNVSNLTDTLLFFLPKELTHHDRGAGPMYWHWSLVALVMAVVFTVLIGRLTRYYFGKKMIELLDFLMLRVPLLNKIYGTVKQVNEAFSPSKQSSFKQVVMVEFPRAGQFAIGFVTGELDPPKGRESLGKLASVFVPTTPNPTSGFLVLVPENEVTKLDMSVADGIKYIISLGAISPDGPPPNPTITKLSNP